MSRQEALRVVARRSGARWKSAGLSVVLSAGLVFSACGGDDTSTDDAPSTVSDAGRDPTGNTKPDASTAAPAVDAGRGSDTGLGGLDAGTDAAVLDSGSGSGSTGTSAAALRGQAIATKNICVSCHQANYAGAGFYPNITPDKTTGIGTWTDKEIGDAITKGVDDEGEKLCAVMARYTFSATELADLIAYLKSLPAKSNDIAAECPGHGE